MTHAFPSHPAVESRPAPVRAITRPPLHHFFGYYDKRQFSASGRYAVGLACDFMGRRQQAGDIATLGMVDLEENDRWIPLGETRAWNWQFGCLAQWKPNSDEEIVFNDRIAADFVSKILHVRTGAVTTCPYPVFDMAPNGKNALTLDFKRLAAVRPETGFRTPEANADLDPAPADDGIYALCLETGERTLLISLKDLAARDPVPGMENAKHYVTHPLWNPSGSRFLFWHRWESGDRCYGGQSRIYTADPDGSDLYRLPTRSNSHTAWRDDSRILAWAAVGNGATHTLLIEDRSDSVRRVGDACLKGNGHFTFSPDGRWLLTDTHPDRNGDRSVLLFQWETERCFEIGRFRSLPELTGEMRCDPHPRWHPDGKRICLDSAHEGSRQMYLLDAHAIARG